MNKRKYRTIINYIRALIYCCIYFSIVNMLIYFQKQIFDRGEIISPQVVLLTSSIASLFIFDRYTYTKKSISFDDKQLTIERIKNIMVKIKWNIEVDDENVKVFKSRFQWWLWRDKIQIYLTDKEIHISGPNEYVDRIIRLSKFTYAAFDITELEK